MKKLKTVFFGTPDFSVPSLDLLSNHPLIDLQYVVSMPDKKQGRGLDLKSPEVISFAKNKKIKIHQTTNINKNIDFLNTLKSEKIDLFIVLAFAQFLSQDVLDIPKLGCFNIHTSLLPKYRGAAPIQYALLNGDTTTGVSIQKMIKKMDAGDIAHAKEIKINKCETGGQLYTRLKFLAALELNNFIYKLDNKEIIYQTQNESGVSFAPTLKREDGYLKFSKDKAQNLLNKIFALYPWPGTYCFLNNKRLKVLSAEIVNQKLTPGTVSISNNTLVIGCLDKSIRVTNLQLEGKKACTDIELLNGIKSEVTIS